MLKECRKLKSDDLIVWNRVGPMTLLAGRCAECGGAGRFFLNDGEHFDCEHCCGCGWFGIDPHVPVEAQPGSIEKIAMLTVRYASGVALWNEGDGYDGDQRFLRTSAQQGEDRKAAGSRRPLTHRTAAEHASAEADSYAVNLAP